MHRFCLSTRSLAVLLALTAIASGCSHRRRPYTREPWSQTTLPPVSELEHRMLLIGDAGAPSDGGEPVVLALADEATRLQEKTSLWFLGDNIYPAGVPLDEESSAYSKAIHVLDSQMAAIPPGVPGYFIPGNHDWDNSREDGWATIIAQESHVEAASGQDTFLPSEGCPGPAIRDFPGIRAIVIDTQWWLHRHQKPTSHCFAAVERGDYEATSRTALQRLKEAFETAGERQIVLLAHHPVDSKGAHGGFFEWRDYIFPLTNLWKYGYVPFPLFYPLARKHIVKSSQDIAGEYYQEMIGLVSSVAASTDKEIIWVGGHDHSLQVLEGPEPFAYTLVSGFGSKEKKESAVGHKKSTLFAHGRSGFMELRAYTGGRLLLGVLEPDQNQKPKLVWSGWLD